MGFAQKAVLMKARGFSLAELIVAMGVASMIGMIVVMLFSTGLFQIRRSSGRIDLVRRARLCIDNTQRYLTAAVRPTAVDEDDESRKFAICDPDPGTAIFEYTEKDPDTGVITDRPYSRVQFWTPVDFIGGVSTATARDLQTAADPAYYIYELAEIDGVNGRGNDVVLRRWSDIGTPDTSVQPRVIARDLGKHDGAGGYYDAFVIRVLSPGAIKLDVWADGSRAHGELEQAAIENSADVLVHMTTVIQLPYYSTN